MKYKKIKDSKTKKYKFPYRELEIKADEIPQVSITGEQYLDIITRHGTLNINARHDKLELTFYNPTGNEVTISKSKKVKLIVDDY